MWWPSLRLLSYLKSPPAPNIEPIFGNAWISPLQPSLLCCSCVCTCIQILCPSTYVCPRIGTACVHSFQFCKSSRWIIAAPKCLICSPGHGQISEPTNLIELSIPAGKGYRVAMHTARENEKVSGSVLLVMDWPKAYCFVLFFLSLFSPAFYFFFKLFSQLLDCKT